MKAGTKIEVRSQLDQSWAKGFVIEAVIDRENNDPEYKVRRLSDGMLLPRTFTQTEVRRERKGGMWWYS